MNRFSVTFQVVWVLGDNHADKRSVSRRCDHEVCENILSELLDVSGVKAVLRSDTCIDHSCNGLCFHVLWADVFTRVLSEPVSKGSLWAVNEGRSLRVWCAIAWVGSDNFTHLHESRRSWLCD